MSDIETGLRTGLAVKRNNANNFKSNRPNVRKIIVNNNEKKDFAQFNSRVESIAIQNDNILGSLVEEDKPSEVRPKTKDSILDQYKLFENSDIKTNNNLRTKKQSSINDHLPQDSYDNTLNKADEGELKNLLNLIQNDKEAYKERKKKRKEMIKNTEEPVKKTKVVEESRPEIVKTESYDDVTNKIDNDNNSQIVKYNRKIILNPKSYNDLQADRERLDLNKPNDNKFNKPKTSLKLEKEIINEEINDSISKSEIKSKKGFSRKSSKKSKYNNINNSEIESTESNKKVSIEDIKNESNPNQEIKSTESNKKVSIEDVNNESNTNPEIQTKEDNLKMKSQDDKSHNDVIITREKSQSSSKHSSHENKTKSYVDQEDEKMKSAYYEEVNGNSTIKVHIRNKKSTKTVKTVKSTVNKSHLTLEKYNEEKKSNISYGLNKTEKHNSRSHSHKSKNTSFEKIVKKSEAIKMEKEVFEIKNNHPNNKHVVIKQTIEVREDRIINGVKSTYLNRSEYNKSFHKDDSPYLVKSNISNTKDKYLKQSKSSDLEKSNKDNDPVIFDEEKKLHESQSIDKNVNVHKSHKSHVNSSNSSVKSLSRSKVNSSVKDANNNDSKHKSDIDVKIDLLYIDQRISSALNKINIDSDVENTSKEDIEDALELDKMAARPNYNTQKFSERNLSYNNEGSEYKNYIKNKALDSYLKSTKHSNERSSKKSEKNTNNGSSLINKSSVIKNKTEKEIEIVNKDPHVVEITSVSENEEYHTNPIYVGYQNKEPEYKNKTFFRTQIYGVGNSENNVHSNKNPVHKYRTLAMDDYKNYLKELDIEPFLKTSKKESIKGSVVTKTFKTTMNSNQNNKFSSVSSKEDKGEEYKIVSKSTVVIENKMISPEKMKSNKKSKITNMTQSKLDISKMEKFNNEDDSFDEKSINSKKYDKSQKDLINIKDNSHSEDKSLNQSSFNEARDKRKLDKSSKISNKKSLKSSDDSKIKVKTNSVHNESEKQIKKSSSSKNSEYKSSIPDIKEERDSIVKSKKFVSEHSIKRNDDSPVIFEDEVDDDKKNVPEIKEKNLLSKISQISYHTIHKDGSHLSQVKDKSPFKKKDNKIKGSHKKINSRVFSPLNRSVAKSKQDSRSKSKSQQDIKIPQDTSLILNSFRTNTVPVNKDNEMDNGVEIELIRNNRNYTFAYKRNDTDKPTIEESKEAVPVENRDRNFTFMPNVLNPSDNKEEIDMTRPKRLSKYAVEHNLSVSSMNIPKNETKIGVDSPKFQDQFPTNIEDSKKEERYSQEDKSASLKNNEASEHEKEKSASSKNSKNSFSKHSNPSSKENSQDKNVTETHEIFSVKNSLTNDRSRSVEPQKSQSKIMRRSSSVKNKKDSLEKEHEDFDYIDKLESEIHIEPLKQSLHISKKSSKISVKSKSSEKESIKYEGSHRSVDNIIETEDKLSIKSADVSLKSITNSVDLSIKNVELSHKSSKKMSEKSLSKHENINDQPKDKDDVLYQSKYLARPLSNKSSSHKSLSDKSLKGIEIEKAPSIKEEIKDNDLPEKELETRNTNSSKFNNQKLKPINVNREIKSENPIRLEAKHKQIEDIKLDALIREPISRNSIVIARSKRELIPQIIHNPIELNSSNEFNLEFKEYLLKNDPESLDNQTQMLRTNIQRIKHINKKLIEENAELKSTLDKTKQDNDQVDTRLQILKKKAEVREVRSMKVNNKNDFYNKRLERLEKEVFDEKKDVGGIFERIVNLNIKHTKIRINELQELEYIRSINNIEFSNKRSYRVIDASQTVPKEF